MTEYDNTFHGLRIICRCGSGGFGEVFFVEDISCKKMALKVVPKSALGDDWERELRGVINYRKITESHPELLQIFHVQDDDDSFFYTMESADSASSSEYIPDTLAYRLQSGPLPAAELLPVLNGIFSGIKAIHSAGFTHRDIKPDNILFVNGVPKLADIGLVSSLSASVTRLAGTLEFIPPEERVADSLDSSDRRARQRNDLYAFGKVIYCAVTGASPHEFPSLPKNLPLSPELKYFLQLAFQLCCKDPLRRINSIAELEKELADIARKLEFGESRLDRIAFFARSVGRYLKSLPVNTWRFLKSYWLWVLSPALVISGSMWWMLKPEKPFADIPSKIYRNEHIKLSMTIPSLWDVITLDTMRKVLAAVQVDENARKQVTPAQLAVITSSFAQKREIITCDSAQDFADNITVGMHPYDGRDIAKLSDDELRWMIKSVIGQAGDKKAEIFKIRRVKIAKLPGVLIEYRFLPPQTQSCQFWLIKGKEILIIKMSAKNRTYNERIKEFESMISTLNFEK